MCWSVSLSDWRRHLDCGYCPQFNTANGFHARLFLLSCASVFVGERELWKPGHARYDAGLQEVAAKVCREEERIIQDLVFKLKVLRAAKADESGNAATKILRRIIRLRRCAYCVDSYSRLDSPLPNAASCMTASVNIVA